MLRIGSLQLKSPVVQAALSGYSDLPMRRIARRHGAEFTMNEVVLDKLVLTRGKRQRFITVLADDDHPVGGQLMGAEPEVFAKAAHEMVEAGYECVDINFGCPVRKVLGKHRGGYLLSDPEAALAIVWSVYQAVGKRRPVTVKMRKGMDDTADSERNFFAILDGAFEIGVDAVTVHGRTVMQRYDGPSDWSFVRRVKRHVGDRVVLGSGDLFTAEDCIRMMVETGVDGVTVARGCIGNPWIFNECRALLAGREAPPPPTLDQQAEVIKAHYNLMVDHYGETLGTRRMRKAAIRYSELHPEPIRARDAWVSVRDRVDFEAVLETWYGSSSKR